MIRQINRVFSPAVSLHHYLLSNQQIGLPSNPVDNRAVCHQCSPLVDQLINHHLRQLENLLFNQVVGPHLSRVWFQALNLLSNRQQIQPVSPLQILPRSQVEALLVNRLWYLRCNHLVNPAHNPADSQVANLLLSLPSNHPACLHRSHRQSLPFNPLYNLLVDRAFNRRHSHHVNLPLSLQVCPLCNLLKLQVSNLLESLLHSRQVSLVPNHREYLRRSQLGNRLVLLRVNLLELRLINHLVNQLVYRRRNPVTRLQCSRQANPAGFQLASPVGCPAANLLHNLVVNLLCSPVAVLLRNPVVHPRASLHVDQVLNPVRNLRDHQPLSLPVSQQCNPPCNRPLNPVVSLV